MFGPTATNCASMGGDSASGNRGLGNIISYDIQVLQQSDIVILGKLLRLRELEIWLTNLFQTALEVPSRCAAAASAPWAYLAVSINRSFTPSPSVRSALSSSLDISASSRAGSLPSTSSKGRESERERNGTLHRQIEAVAAVKGSVWPTSSSHTQGFDLRHHWYHESSLSSVYIILLTSRSHIGRPFSRRLWLSRLV